MYFIFKVHLKRGYKADQYAAAWIRASQLIQQAPGARGTRLHRKIGDETTLLAIASWATKTQRDAMEASAAAEIEAIILTQQEFVEIEVVGEFEDATWRVDPDSPAELY